tara:strand:- start:454 stop:1377 length:924 start_codon:yes stop_codon:yes gene_type:complete
MSKYYCFVCDYDAKQKSNYDKHIKTKRHKMLSTKSHQKSPFSHQKSPFSHQKSPFFSTLKSTSSEKFQCKYCKKDFKFKQGMYRHIKYTCKKNKDEDFQELARLLNEKDKQIALKDKQLDKQLALRDKKMEIMQKQIEKLTNKLQIQNINQGIVQNVNNTINIQVLNHSDTDYSHLTPKDYITCIKDCNKCVKTLIEKVHFNANKPENMNIYLSNIKGKYLMIYKDNAWQIQDKKTQVDDLYDNNEFVLEAWYDEYKEKYPDIIASFQRYLQNRDEDEMLNNIKEEILVMLYNKRKMIAIEGIPKNP